MKPTNRKTLRGGDADGSLAEAGDLRVQKGEEPIGANTFRLRTIHRKLPMIQAIGFTSFVLVFTCIVAFAGGNWLGVLLFLGAFVPFYWLSWFFSWAAVLELELRSESIMFRTPKGMVLVPYSHLRVMPFILGRFGPVFLEDTVSGKRFVILRETESFPEIMRLLASRGVKGSKAA